jgi:hypothetical protein
LGNTVKGEVLGMYPRSSSSSSGLLLDDGLVNLEENGKSGSKKK